MVDPDLWRFPPQAQRTYSEALRIIDRIRSGLSGMSWTCTPIGDKALDTALERQAPVATIPISPAPFAPSGFKGDGARSKTSQSTAGRSVLVGSR